MHSLRTGLFYLFLTACCAQGASAQDRVPLDGKRTFEGGIVAGANMCEIIGDAYHGYHKLGIHAGAIVYATIFDQVGASVEILYSQKGTRGVREIYSSYAGQMFEKYYVDLDYVEVPVQLQFFSGGKFHFGGGVSYSRLINSKEDIVTDQPVYINQDEHPFLKNDLAYVLSGNFRFWKGWFISGRYQRSIRPIRNWENVPYLLGSGNQYNTYFTLRLVYLIP